MRKPSPPRTSARDDTRSIYRRLMRLLPGACATTTLFAIVYVPPLIAWIGSTASRSTESVLNMLSFALLMEWGIWLFPHDSIVLRQANYSEAVFDHPMLVANIQWLVVALIFGVMARNIRWRRRIFYALITVVAVGILTHVVISLAGLQVEADGP